MRSLFTKYYTCLLLAEGASAEKKPTSRPSSVDKESQTPPLPGAVTQKSHSPSPPAIPPRKIDVDSNKQATVPPSTSNVPIEVLSAKSIKVSSTKSKYWHITH